VKHKGSWISLVGYCVMTALAAALVFAIILAGGSVALASHQSAGAEELQENNPAIPENSAALHHSDQQRDSTTPQQHSDVASFSGLVTDSHCGARHQRHSNLSPEACARACIRNGATYVLVNGDHRYNLSGSEETLSKLVGTRATITGTLDGGTIAVSSAGSQL
jgi:hypothetical protein